MLIFFFIVPLFGVVIVGMLWKRATPAGAFVGFLTAILVSMGMWVYVHTFPNGYRPQPKVVLDPGAVVRIQRWLPAPPSKSPEWWSSRARYGRRMSR